jgi:hypothetical protein
LNADWLPRPVDRPPVASDAVQVVMTEKLARRFERECLTGARLSTPLLFPDSGLPTYIIEADPHH